MTASASTATPTGTPFRVEAEHVVIAAGGRPNRSQRTGHPMIVDANIDYRRRTQTGNEDDPESLLNE